MAVYGRPQPRGGGGGPRTPLGAALRRCGPVVPRAALRRRGPGCVRCRASARPPRPRDTGWADTPRARWSCRRRCPGRSSLAYARGRCVPVGAGSARCAAGDPGAVRPPRPRGRGDAYAWCGCRGVAFRGRPWALCFRGAPRAGVAVAPVRVPRAVVFRVRPRAPWSRPCGLGGTRAPGAIRLPAGCTAGRASVALSARGAGRSSAREWPGVRGRASPVRGSRHRAADSVPARPRSHLRPRSRPPCPYRRTGRVTPRRGVDGGFVLRRSKVSPAG